ncbi:hypothetical protein VNO77_34403 [Canavalia gladiata]|uniref:Uncharacterized protein n=1 Tax=Canavalia gladiata TaxID=3824 RepID=A0AAN9KE66_CANGL
MSHSNLLKDLQVLTLLVWDKSVVANKEDRLRKAMEDQAIIGEESKKFEAWRDSLEIFCTIKKLRGLAHFHEILQEAYAIILSFRNLGIDLPLEKKNKVTTVAQNQSIPDSIAPKKEKIHDYVSCSNFDTLTNLVLPDYVSCSNFDTLTNLVRSLAGAIPGKVELNVHGPIETCNQNRAHPQDLILIDPFSIDGIVAQFTTAGIVKILRHPEELGPIMVIAEALSQPGNTGSTLIIFVLTAITNFHNLLEAGWRRQQLLTTSRSIEIRQLLIDGP